MNEPSNNEVSCNNVMSQLIIDPNVGSYSANNSNNQNDVCLNVSTGNISYKGFQCQCITESAIILGWM